MTLLNSHPDIYCSGEQFNPSAIVGIAGDTDSSHEAFLTRDKDPLGHMQKFFEETCPKDVLFTGFKFMIGHNIQVLRSLQDQEDIAIVYVWRENRLAQTSSLIKADVSKVWAQTEPTDNIDRKIYASPRQVSQRWHELATYDYLIQDWLVRQKNRHITFEYRDMFAPGFNARLCDFIGVKNDPQMKSPLLKQGANRVLDRFEDPGPLRYYFTQLGLSAWLEEEL